MTGYYRQAYQEAFTNTVRKRLFFVSVCALQWLSRTVPSHDLGAALSTSLNVSECVALQRGAVLHGYAASGCEEAQHQADRAMLDRWGTAYGSRVDWEGARGRLCARLTIIATRHVADSPR